MRSLYMTLLMLPALVPALLVSCSPPAYAQTPLGENVPDAARREIHRRGCDVQEVDGIAAGPEDYVRDALAPPADDSHKWWLTVVIKEKHPACELLKRDFAQAEPLRDLVNVADPLASWAHYQVRNLDDSTQRDWFAKLDPKIDRSNLPVLIIQPPLSGKYGPATTLVGYVANYKGEAAAYRDQVLAQIKLYVDTLVKKGELRASGPNTDRGGFVPAAAGHNQAPPASGIGAGAKTDWPFEGPPVADPFVLDPRVTPGPSPNAVIGFPTVGQRLTAQQIRAAIPNVEPAFVEQALEAGVVDVQTLLQLYQIFKSRITPPAPVPGPSPVPAPDGGGSLLTTLLAIFGGGTLTIGTVIGLFLLGWGLYRQFTPSEKHMLTDAQYQRVTAFLRTLDGNPNNDGPAPAPAR